MMHSGNHARIIKAMKKAMEGKPVTVGFLGGSITQGSLSGTPKTCYAYLVYDWWVKNFPQSNITYVNAGIGGTPSNFGVARVDDDLLCKQPDFCTTEFAVNDDNTPHFMETYEGLVRHILSDERKPGLMLIMNVRYDNMESAEDKHLPVAKYYDVPTVSMKHSVYPLVANGTIPNREITPDDLHPNDVGHRLLANLVIHMLEKIKKEAEEGVCVEDFSSLPAPLTKNRYEHSNRLQVGTYSPKLSGFVPDDTPQNHITEMFRHGYTAWKEGDSISFEASSKGLSVQFRKSVNLPAPIAKAVVDGDEAHAVILDANFDETWGDCLYTATVLDDDVERKHTVTITIVKDHSKEERSDAVPFYLVSVIASK